MVTYYLIAILLLLIFLGIGFAVYFTVKYFINKSKYQDNMEKKHVKFTDSFTFKGIIITVLTLLLLIPGAILQDLISERQHRSIETVEKINNKWSLAQTLCPPTLVIPYTQEVYRQNSEGKTIRGWESHQLYVTPKDVKVTTLLQPEERYYGIYKAILYKSDIHIDGEFGGLESLSKEGCVFHFEDAYVLLGVTDLRGIREDIDFKLNGRDLKASVGEKNQLFAGNLVEESEIVARSSSFKSSEYDYKEYEESIEGKSLLIKLNGLIAANKLSEKLKFSCNLKLNGSSEINFIPIAQNTQVRVEGQWQAPSFIGAFSPEYTLDKDQFKAEWSVLSFNRSIPESWTDNELSSLRENSFGVNLVDTVNHYQQNMRSAKYALLFIVLTFVIFFFVEVFTKKSIHPIQYLLVGIALVLFYSLLLSLSEHAGFAWAYVIASVATVSLITAYGSSIFKQGLPTAILAAVLSLLYVFLYVILQLENMALLIGNIGLFVILAVIMFVSRKVKWQRNDA